MENALRTRPLPAHTHAHMHFASASLTSFSFEGEGLPAAASLYKCLWPHLFLSSWRRLAEALSPTASEISLLLMPSPPNSLELRGRRRRGVGGATPSMLTLSAFFPISLPSHMPCLCLHHATSSLLFLHSTSLPLPLCLQPLAFCLHASSSASGIGRKRNTQLSLTSPASFTLLLCTEALPPCCLSSLNCLSLSPHL